MREPAPPTLAHPLRSSTLNWRQGDKIYLTDERTVRLLGVRDVVVTFHCTDNGANQSAVASVDPPVTVSAAGTTNGVAGNCSDVAGNTANPPAFSVRG